MGRKNRNVRRSNDRNRLARKAREDLGIKPRPIFRDSVERLIIPDGRCRTGKATYSTEGKARQALKAAQRARTWSGSGHVEKRYYRCDLCSGFHLTSRDTHWRRDV